MFDVVYKRFKKADQRTPRHAIAIHLEMPHRNPARLARSNIHHSRSGDDNPNEFVQLADGIGVDRRGVGDGGGGPEQARHQVGGFSERIFAPVVLEVGDGQVVVRTRRGRGKRRVP